MGKRELLLIVAFAIVGAIVYQVTAPPPAPGERSFSASQIIENMRRGMRGNRASADAVNTSSHPVDAGITELQLTNVPAELTVVGEDRADVSAEVKVHSRAYDDAEAQRTAKATVLKVERQGIRLVAAMWYPEEGSQTATLTLHVPSRLQLKIGSSRGQRTRVTNVAAMDAANGRGTTEVRQIAGRVTGNYRGGDLRVVGAGSIKLTTVGTDVRLEQVAGEAILNIRAGNLKSSDMRGPIDIDATGVDVELQKLQKMTGALKITAAAGSVSVKDLRSSARIDARGTDVEVVADHAAPLEIYSEGGSPVDLTPPPGGYQLDAVATDGSISVPEGTVEVTQSGQEHRAAGAVKGGGPTITIRATHGSITLRDREETDRQ